MWQDNGQFDTGSLSLPTPAKLGAFLCEKTFKLGTMQGGESCSM